MTTHKDVATAVQQWSVSETRQRACNEKCDHAELCEYMQGFTNIFAIACLMCQKLTFAGAILAHSETSLPQLVFQAAYEPVFVTLYLSFGWNKVW